MNPTGDPLLVPGDVLPVLKIHAHFGVVQAQYHVERPLSGRRYIVLYLGEIDDVNADNRERCAQMLRELGWVRESDPETATQERERLVKRLGEIDAAKPRDSLSPFEDHLNDA